MYGHEPKSTMFGWNNRLTVVVLLCFFTKVSGQIECGAGRYPKPVEEIQKYYPGYSGYPVCTSCPIGTYSDSDNATECTPCPEGTTTIWDGADYKYLCTKCPFGFIEENLECVPCPNKTYFTYDFATVGKGYTCERCNIVQDDHCVFEWCPYEGYYTAVSIFNNNGQGPCKECPIGTYSERGNVRACEPCPAGKTTFYPATQSVDDCIKCDPGYIEVDGSCKACPQGTYMDGGRGEKFTCENCPGLLTTQGEGTFSRRGCHCDLGVEPGYPECRPCSVGYYKDFVESSRCKKCPEFHTTIGDFSKSTSDCVCAAGAEMNLEVNSCVQCSLGEYSDEVNSNCKKCPEKMTTLGFGSSSVSDCVCAAGYFHHPFEGVCVACPAGTFSAGANSTICMRCPDGTASSSQAASECLAP